MNIIDNTWRATSRILALTTILLFAPMTWAQSDEEADEEADADTELF